MLTDRVDGSSMMALEKEYDRDIVLGWLFCRLKDWLMMS